MLVVVIIIVVIMLVVFMLVAILVVVVFTYKLFRCDNRNEPSNHVVLLLLACVVPFMVPLLPRPIIHMCPLLPPSSTFCSC